MQVELGQKYKRRDGKIVGPAYRNEMPNKEFPWLVDNWLYRDDGTSYTRPELDLIHPWPGKYTLTLCNPTGHILHVEYESDKPLLGLIAQLADDLQKSTIDEILQSLTTDTMSAAKGDHAKNAL